MGLIDVSSSSSSYAQPHLPVPGNQPHAGYAWTAAPAVQAAASVVLGVASNPIVIDEDEEPHLEVTPQEPRTEGSERLRRKRPAHQGGFDYFHNPGNAPEIIELDDEDEPSYLSAQSLTLSFSKYLPRPYQASQPASQRRRVDHSPVSVWNGGMTSAGTHVRVDAPGKDLHSPTSILEVQSPATPVVLSTSGWRALSHMHGPQGIPPIGMNPPSRPVSVGAQDPPPLERSRTCKSSMDVVAVPVHEQVSNALQAMTPGESCVDWKIKFEDALQFGNSTHAPLVLSNEDLEPSLPIWGAHDDNTEGALASPISQVFLERPQGSAGGPLIAKDLQVEMGTTEASGTILAKVKASARGRVKVRVRVQVPSLEAETTTPPKVIQSPHQIPGQVPSLEAETTISPKGFKSPHQVPDQVPSLEAETTTPPKGIKSPHQIPGQVPSLESETTSPPKDTKAPQRIQVRASTLQVGTVAPPKGPKTPHRIRVQAPTLVPETKSPLKVRKTADFPHEDWSPMLQSTDMSDTEAKAKAKALEDEMAELWREAALAEELGKPAPIETELEQKPVRCIHNYERNAECGQVCSLCGHVKAAMSVEFFAPLRAARRRQQREEQDKDFLGEDKIFIDIGPYRSQPEEKPIEQLKVKIPPHFMSKMKEHQVKGFQFLVNSLDGRGGCIFAHAPGTGKTFLMIAFVKGLLTSYPTKKVLIVAPKVMVEPWKDEFQRWKVRDINILTIYDKSTETHDVEERRREILHQWKEEKSVLMVSYNIVSRIILKEGKQHDELRDIIVGTPDVVILDEGHFVRTKRTNALQALKKVKTSNRVILSGTLFQNNFEELYQMLSFVKPDFLGNDPEFMRKRMALEQEQENDRQRNIGRITQAMVDKWGKQRETMSESFWEAKCKSINRTADSHARDLSIQTIRNLTPFVDCHEGAALKSLPGLSEFVVHLKLQPLQAKLVEKVRLRYGNQLLKNTAHTRLVIFHPCLCPSEYREDFPHLDGTRSSPSKGVKVDFVMQILNLCDKAGEKLIVFSRLLEPLNYIQEVLQTHWNWVLGDKVLSVDGKDTLRNDTIKKFNDKKHPSRVLLASIKACGEGVNLTGASRIILLEPDYNPSVTRQAVSRAFRVGQEKKVVAYHLIAADTVESEIRRRACDKEWVSRNLFGSEGIADNSDQEIRDPSSCPDEFFRSHAVTKHLDRLYMAQKAL